MKGGGDLSILGGGVSCNYPMTSAERKEEFFRSIHHLSSFHSLKLERLTLMLAWVLGYWWGVVCILLGECVW